MAFRRIRQIQICRWVELLAITDTKHPKFHAKPHKPNKHNKHKAIHGQTPNAKRQRSSTNRRQRDELITRAGGDLISEAWN